MDLRMLFEPFEECVNYGFSLNTFANDKFRLLEKLSDNQTITEDKPAAVYMTQQQIADMCGMSKLKANHLINDLKNEGFLSCGRNCYVITEKAATAIKLMNKTNL